LLRRAYSPARNSNRRPLPNRTFLDLRRRRIHARVARPARQRRGREPERLEIAGVCGRRGLRPAAPYLLQAELRAAYATTAASGPATLDYSSRVVAALPRRTGSAGRQTVDRAAALPTDARLAAHSATPGRARLCPRCRFTAVHGSIIAARYLPSAAPARRWKLLAARRQAATAAGRDGRGAWGARRAARDRAVRMPISCLPQSLETATSFFQQVVMSAG
jgi:hypothetical protein